MLAAQVCKRMVAAHAKMVCRYAAYSITPHTSPEPSSATLSSILAVSFQHPNSTGVSRRDKDKEDVDAVSIDNGIICVNFSDVTGQVVSLDNRQAEVGYHCSLRTSDVNILL